VAGGTIHQLSLAEIASIAGALADENELRALLAAMGRAGWLVSDQVRWIRPRGGRKPEERLDLQLLGCGIRLTFEGWSRYAELSRASRDTRKAFMAMAFRDSHGLPEAYLRCFKPAVAAAGFNLERLDEGQGAGLIDDQLRVAIRTARFLVADLTTLNRGAYWEAGFAEGLGKPVIYVCHQDVWNSKDDQVRPHFDTSHLVTVPWSLETLDDARRRLTAAIRNTFPTDATMED
jgi:hypothetical protein